MNDHDVIDLYNVHGECEQFYSEIKTDMDLEWLLSGKFGHQRTGDGACHVRIQHTVHGRSEIHRLPGNRGEK